jgi:hypothetical protein
MSLTHYMTKEYENKSGLLTMEKQTQSNPILSASGGFKMTRVMPGGRHTCSDRQDGR